MSNVLIQRIAQLPCGTNKLLVVQSKPIAIKQGNYQVQSVPQVIDCSNIINWTKLKYAEISTPT